MQITQISFQNYRNVNGLSIQFPTGISFIIGENGIGKSNILNALSKIFIYGKFSEQDFNDSEKEIRIDITLLLSNDDIGSFDEYTSPSNPNIINLIIRQDVDDYNFKVYHLETGDEISPRLLKNVNYIYYDSLRNPKTELSFEKDRGSGSFLNFIIKYFLEKHDEADDAYVNKDKLSEILSFINKSIGDLQTVKRNHISVHTDSNNINFLNRIFQLYDNKDIELKHSGYGIQFSLLVIFSLFERLIEITTKSKKSSRPIEEITCILAFDEPEIHLHPFAQRALIKELMTIANGKDQGFNNVVKELFGLEAFSAQLLIVSHSDRIISGSYENIVRLYSAENDIKSVSGQWIKDKHSAQLKKDEKHLQKLFPYFCEALFAKKVLFVEGESELGAIHTFAKLMDIDLDSYGVSVINASGGESINPLINLFSLFQIDCIGVKDRDVYDRKRKVGLNTDSDDCLIAVNKLVLTNEPNFEFEIIEACEDLDDFYAYLKSIDATLVLKQQPAKINKFIEDYNYPVTPFSTTLGWSDCKDILNKKLFLLVSLSGIKSITTGAIIAEKFTKETIPKIYKTILEGLIV